MPGNSFSNIMPLNHSMMSDANEQSNMAHYFGTNFDTSEVK